MIERTCHVGLDLVNGLTLSEYKAVLAHEFGHFSQSSMRLGGYVYMANWVISIWSNFATYSMICWQKPAARTFASPFSLHKSRSKGQPALQNMQAGNALRDYPLQAPLLNPMLCQTRIDADWISALMRKISQIEERYRCLYFKSMGAILLWQEAIAQNYRSKIAS